MFIWRIAKSSEKQSNHVSRWRQKHTRLLLNLTDTKILVISGVMLMRQSLSLNNNTETKTYKGKTLSDLVEIARAFACHFYSTDLPHHVICPQIPGTGNHPVKLSKLNSGKVTLALKKLQPKKSLGPDKVPPYTYKACHELLAESLPHV